MSFNIANTGLSAVTQQLGAISNNIANSNTVGYKSMRAEFAALYAGGQPMGVGVSGITQSISSGGQLAASTRALDLGISGNGFFVTKDSSGAVSYTRAGNFGLDAQGYVEGISGRLQGYGVDENGNVMQGAIGDLQIRAGNIGAKATSKVDIVANLNKDSEIPKTTPFNKDDSSSYNNMNTSTIYDSQGGEHTVTQYFIRTGENKWTVMHYVDGNEQAKQDIEFDTNGKLTGYTPQRLTAPAGGAATLDFEVNLNGTTQFGSDFNVSKNEVDGYPPGERSGLSIDNDGKVYATFSNGQKMLQGQIVMATFPNPDGLQSINNTAWTSNNKSGNALIGVPGAGMNGKVESFKTESSNVDMTGELVGLMSAQRNYQANTKVISTNDQMMNALFQAL